MSAGPIIREATLADVPALRRYAMDLFSERLPTLLNLDPDISLEDEEAFVRPYLDKPGWLLLMAEDPAEEGAEAEDGEGTVGAAEVIAVLSFQGREHAYLTHSGEFGISVRRDWRAWTREASGVCGAGLKHTAVRKLSKARRRAAVLVVDG